MNHFNIEDSQWVKEAFENKKYAFAADYIRLYAIYTYGGIYMDMDIEVLKQFDSLLDKPYMFAYERSNRIGIEAGCFGAEKGNEFIKACLEHYTGRSFVKPNGEFDTLPLPQIMQKVMDEHGFQYEMYPWDYFTAKSYDTGIETPTENTFCIHHFAGSWKTEEEKQMLLKKRKYAAFMGKMLARNIVDFQYALKNGGIKQAFLIGKEKIQRKRNGRSQSKRN